MIKCPKCGHEWPDKKRASGGKARWKGLTKKQRSEAAKKAAQARWRDAIETAAAMLQDGPLPEVAGELRRGLRKGLNGKVD